MSTDQSNSAKKALNDGIVAFAKGQPVEAFWLKNPTGSKASAATLASIAALMGEKKFSVGGVVGKTKFYFASENSVFRWAFRLYSPLVEVLFLWVLLFVLPYMVKSQNGIVDFMMMCVTAVIALVYLARLSRITVYGPLVGNLPMGRFPLVSIGFAIIKGASLFGMLMVGLFCALFFSKVFLGMDVPAVLSEDYEAYTERLKNIYGWKYWLFVAWGSVKHIVLGALVLMLIGFGWVGMTKNSVNVLEQHGLLDRYAESVPAIAEKGDVGVLGKAAIISFAFALYFAVGYTRMFWY